MWYWNVLNMFEMYVGYVWRLRSSNGIQNSLICLSGAIHAGMRSKSFCRTAVMWFAAQNLMIKTWNDNFSHWPFLKKKIQTIKPLGNISEQAWFGVKFAQFPQEILCSDFVIFVPEEISMFALQISCFKVCQVSSVWPRWGVLFEDRWRLRPHNYVKWLKCFGYAWIGSTG